MMRTLLYITTVISVVVTIGACERTPRDRAYYMAHPDEAKIKLDECKQAMRTNMKMLTDPECIAAGNVLENIKEKERVERMTKEKHKDCPIDSWLMK